MVAPIILAASFVFAIPAVLAEPLSPGALLARQLPSGIDPSAIPQACVSSCDALSNTIGTGTCADLSCLCTNAIDSGIKSCLACGLKAGVPNLNQTVVDETVSGYEEACSEGGFPVSGSSSSSSGTTGSGTSGSGTTGSGSSGSGTTTGSSATNTAASNPLTQKNDAMAHYSVSIIGSVFALAMSGFALL